MPAEVEVEIARLRFAHPSWGPRRLVFELDRAGVRPVPGRTSVYRALVRLNLIDPAARRPRDRKWKRWERGAPMELWQMDVVGGFVLADGTRAKVLSGVDDHSRFCVSAHLMTRETSQKVCDGLAKALRAYGVPQAILTDNGKVFTGRFNLPPAEVLFDRICRENGIQHLLTQPRSPTTTGKIERFHRAIRTEFRTDRAFASLPRRRPSSTNGSSDYNTNRPHQALDMATPAQRFWREDPAPVTATASRHQHADDPTQPAATASGSAAEPAPSASSWSLAAGLPRRRRRRPQHRRLGHQRRPAVLRRRHAPAHPATHLRRDGESQTIDGPETGPVTSKRVSRINRTRSVNHQPEPFRGTPAVCRRRRAHFWTTACRRMFGRHGVDHLRTPAPSW